MDISIKYEFEGQRSNCIGSCIDRLMSAGFKRDETCIYHKNDVYVGVWRGKIDIKYQPAAELIGEGFTEDQLKAVRIVLRRIVPLKILDELGNELKPETFREQNPSDNIPP